MRFWAILTLAMAIHGGAFAECRDHSESAGRGWDSTDSTPLILSVTPDNRFYVCVRPTGTAEAPVADTGSLGGITELGITLDKPTGSAGVSSPGPFTDGQVVSLEVTSHAGSGPGLITDVYAINVFGRSETPGYLPVELLFAQHTVQPGSLEFTMLLPTRGTIVNMPDGTTPTVNVNDHPAYAITSCELEYAIAGPGTTGVLVKSDIPAGATEIEMTLDLPDGSDAVTVWGRCSNASGGGEDSPQVTYEVQPIELQMKLEPPTIELAGL